MYIYTYCLLLFLSSLLVPNPFLLILILFDLVLILLFLLFFLFHFSFYCVPTFFTYHVHVHTFLIRTVTSSWMLSMCKVSHTYMMTFTSTKANIKRVSLKYKLLSLKSMVNHHTLHISHMFSTYQTHIFLHTT